LRWLSASRSVRCSQLRLEGPRRPRPRSAALWRSRVVVEPGARLALHHHLGTQVARVQSGVLGYTVRRGSVVVRSGESDQSPQVVRRIGAGQTGSIRAGEWIVEQPSVIHQAANRGTEPVVIYLATLLEKGAPPSTPVSLPATD
jgi:quercetin dioxygenase-like cupin family protein